MPGADAPSLSHASADEPSDVDFYQKVLESLEAAAGLRKDKPFLSSLNLLTENTSDEVDLISAARHPTDCEHSPSQKLPGNAGAYAPSITGCTVLMSRTHLLNYVDERHEASIEIDSSAADVISPILETVSRDTCWLVPIPGSPNFRLSISRNDPSIMDLLRNSDFGRNYPILVDKLLARKISNYGQLYVEPRREWPRGGSELCAPILLCGQSLGCVNIESQQPYAMNPEVLNVITFLCGMAGVAIATRMKSSLIREVNLLVNKMISAGSTASSSWDTPLFNFALAVRKILWCRHVEFVVRASNPWGNETVYSRLVDSVTPPSSIAGLPKEHNLRSPLRPDGWTSKVGLADDDTLGAILHIDKPVFSSAAPMDVYPKKGYWIRRDSNGRVELIAMKEAEVHLEMRLNAKEHKDCTWFFAIRLPVTVTRHGQANPSLPGKAVLWIHHAERGSCQFGSSHRVDKKRLTIYCEHAISIAEACSIVPAMWETSVAGWEQTHAFLNHGGLSEPIGSLYNAIDRGLERCDNDSDRLFWRTRKALAEYLADKVETYTDVLTLWDSKRLRNSIVERASREQEISLREFCDNCWMAATMLKQYSLDVESNIHWTNNVEPDLTIRTSRRHLRELVVQCLRNCRKHGVERDFIKHKKALKVAISAELLASGVFRIIIEDTGPGFDSTLLDRVSFSLIDIRNRIASGQGLGLYIMYNFAAAIGDDKLVIDSGANGKGARISFRIVDRVVSNFETTTVGEIL
jgi:hypothetical protein